MTSNQQVSRMLTMVPYLRAHPGVSTAEVAKMFGITERQVVADLERLWMCGLPGGLPDDLIDIDMDAVEGRGTITLGNADYLTRPMRFTPDEAAAMLVALQGIRELAAGEMRAAADRVIAKLSGVVAGNAQVEASPVTIETESGADEVRAALASAIEDGRAVQLDYDGAARGETTHPVVDPAVMVLREGVAYLQAWSHDRSDWRIYRVDRIAAVTPTQDAVGEHGRPPVVPTTWFDDASDANIVTLSLDLSDAWVIEYYPHRALTRLPDGGVQADFVVADPSWLRGLLLRLGDGVRVLAPTDAGASAAEAARAALALYDATEPLSQGAHSTAG